MPPELILINHGHDGDLDCYDLSRTDETSRISICYLEANESEYPLVSATRKHIAFSLTEYLEAQPGFYVDPDRTVQENLESDDKLTFADFEGWYQHEVANRASTNTPSMIRFRAKLFRPAAPTKASWTFLTLPIDVSAKLASRGTTTVEGTINGIPFRAILEPDGQKSHWVKVDRKLRDVAGADVGDVVTLEITPSAEEMESRVPADLRKALAAAAKARALWSDITPIARRDWIQWIVSARQPETRARRVKNACSMLAAGKRRVCCFDRSGFFSKSLSSPKAAS